LRKFLFTFKEFINSNTFFNNTSLFVKKITKVMADKKQGKVFVKKLFSDLFCKKNLFFTNKIFRVIF